MLILILLVPLLILLYVRVLRSRQRVARGFGSRGQEMGTRQLEVRRHIPILLFLTGLTLLLVAMARPQMVVSLPRIEGTVILAFDVSGSMAAEDLSPNRMEAAKTAALAFVQEQPTYVQIGVVTFSDSGFAVQPPTDDQDAIFAAIGRLTPERGTSLANGILASLNIITSGEEQDTRLYSDLTPVPTPTPTPVPQGVYQPATIVLLTDGENNVSPDPLSAAQEAADRGVRIHTVGIGSAAGTTIEVEGFMIHTQLNEAMLQQISQITGGEYYSAESEGELLSIYQNLDPQLVVKPEQMEITSSLAGASILILMIGGTFSLLWFRRLP
jgi:Ca-activated chloride channel family protein